MTNTINDYVTALKYLGMIATPTAIGTFLAINVATNIAYNPPKYIPKEEIAIIAQATKLEQQVNPANAEAIANQLGGWSNLEAIVASSPEIGIVKFCNPDTPLKKNFNNANSTTSGNANYATTYYLQSITNSVDNNGQAMISISYVANSANTKVQNSYMQPNDFANIVAPGPQNVTQSFSANNLKYAMEDL